MNLSNRSKRLSLSRQGGSRTIRKLLFFLAAVLVAVVGLRFVPLKSGGDIGRDSQAPSDRHQNWETMSSPMFGTRGETPTAEIPSGTPAANDPKVASPKTDDPPTGAARPASFVKMELLIKAREPLSAQKTSSRNIFLMSRNSAPPPGAKVKPPIEEKKPLPPPVEIIPPIRLRLVGIINKNEKDDQGRPVLLAILAEGERSFFAKKGDRIMEQYEVLEVGENSVEVKDLIYNRTEKLELDE